MHKTIAYQNMFKLLGTYLLVVFVLSSCIYVPDVQQGNLITQEMVDKLKPGLTQQQVRFILGTPLVRDPFHIKRWDYLYSLQTGNAEEVERRQLTVFFNDDKLDKIVVKPASIKTDDDFMIEPKIYSSPAPDPVSSNPPALMQRH